MNRSDDEDDDEDDDEYESLHSGSGMQPFPANSDFFYPVNFDDPQVSYCSDSVLTAAEVITAKERLSPVCGDVDIQTPLKKDKVAEELGHDNSYECNASSAIYSIESAEKDPVDFENNERLWLPPEPENEEDERDSSLLEDDDGDNTMGEWGYLQSSSFGSVEYQSKNRSSEEHKKAMKIVVDGHFRALVAQLLQVENLPVGDEHEEDGWLDIITTLSWKAATLLKPDTSEGGGMDPGGYVKVKCVACGSRKESIVVKGVVCKKNVAHRRMSSRVEKPRLLILGGALEYQRVTNLLSSFDTLLQQMAVAKIDAHHPNVLLVEKSVSRYAQDYLLAKNISLVLNIKRPLLERLVRCTGAQIVPSVDHMKSPKLGHCDLFHVEKFIEDHGSAGQNGKKLTKTLMFFEGCPKPLGCTILLKGANGDELKKVKHVIQYGVFAAYHLALETSFLADEGASLPELPLKSPITVALPDKPSATNKSISTIPGFIFSSSGKPYIAGDTLNSASNFRHASVDAADYPTRRCGQIEQFIERPQAMLGNSSSMYMLSGFQDVRCQPCCDNGENNIGLINHFEAKASKRNVAVMNDVSNTEIDSCGNLGTSHLVKIMENGEKKDNNIILGKHSGNAEHQNKNNGDEPAFTKEDFSPSDHQSILVLLTSRCVWKGTVCERAHLFRIKYYGTFDKPLGRFLRDHLFDQSYRCRSCEMPSEAHVHCYTHRQGSLTISVRKILGFYLPGERDGKIWMWHRCLNCPRMDGLPPPTRRVVMSDAAWGLSFGKFLELSFSNHAAASRVASCGHSLHRDCLRFYGFGRMVACFRYAPVHLHSVFLPLPKLDFSCKHQEWKHKDAKLVADMAELVFSEVLNALGKLAERKPRKGPLSGKEIENRRSLIDFEEMLKKEKAEFEECIRKIVKDELTKEEPEVDILEINKLRRELLFLAFLWDQRLIFASGLDHGNRVVFRSFITRSKDKIATTMKLDPNAVTRLFRGSTSFYTVKNDPLDKEGSHKTASQINETQQIRDFDQESIQNHEDKDPSTFVSSNIKLDPIESGVVHMVISDGQFSATGDTAGTFDSKWTFENRSQIPEVCMSISSCSVGIDSSALVSRSSEEHVRADAMEFPDSSSSSEIESKSKDLSKWIQMPFIQFYNLVNKSFGTFDGLYEYNPVYIFSFRELERQDGARVLLPVGLDDTVIPIYDDEPTSVISYALVSPDYHFQLSDSCEKTKDGADYSTPLTFFEIGNVQSFKPIDEGSSESLKSNGTVEYNTLPKSSSRTSLVGDLLVYNKALHVRVSFSDNGSLGKVKYTVTCYFAKQFDSLRRICCPSELDFIRSLSRCKKWGAQGGKSNVFFAKSLDDRFIVKQVTKTELESFMKFAPEYFKYLSESISTGSPMCLAKILGIYQVTIKHVKGGKELRMDVLVMENLLFGRNVTRLYDLKGSLRSRYNPDCNGTNKVLLDQNLIETMPTSPIFVGNKAKRLLERAVWNDTSFLASIDVMDYSLLVGVDEEKHELILGIIDFMRQYTWDKHLETWVKAAGILGGPKNVSPTVISPEQYKKRFRKAMSAYFLVVPDQWSPPTVISSTSQTDLCEGNQLSASHEP
ncbi:hypothetical protein HPP92_026955 [Vanilla planifolia]|uniref:1-phosphatidylinositol-3-phosphate 5-kinase n=1 Tax=Vanilla planifolia TaxID=51239 RepID=A0A835U8S0_VANPL|nr:hypothetical protein HPP92_026955 [Vanilla planifolia]